MATEELLSGLMPLLDLSLPRELGAASEADEEPALLAELAEVVDAATPTLRDELALATTDEDRLRAFVTWWCGLPPVLQLGLALLLQWLTLGLSAEYLKENGMLPGLSSRGSDDG
jgi:hypothetical protein